MRYLVIGDIHLSDRPPSSCTEDYLDDLFAILEHTAKLEGELDVEGVIWSGDIFHHKQPNRNSHRLVQRAIGMVKRYKKLWIVPGNHDMLNDRFDSIADSQPLGVLFEAGAELLNGWERTGEHPIYGIPWNQHWDEQTVKDSFAEWGTDPRHPPETLGGALVVAHAPLYPPGHELEFEYYPTRVMNADRTGDTRAPWSMIQAVGYCYYGHVHEAHGTYKVGDVTFCNQGAITRGSLHESELNRKIAVTTWSPEEGFIRIDVPHKPADEVFRLMEKREIEDAQVRLDDFLESVGQTKLEITSLEAVMKHIRELQLEPELTKMAEELLTQAQDAH